MVELTAWLCREFRLDPEEDVIRHYDVTGKLCPLYYVEHPEEWSPTPFTCSSGSPGRDHGLTDKKSSRT